MKDKYARYTTNNPFIAEALMKLCKREHIEMTCFYDAPKDIYFFKSPTVSEEEMRILANRASILQFARGLFRD